MVKNVEVKTPNTESEPKESKVKSVKNDKRDKSEKIEAIDTVEKKEGKAEKNSDGELKKVATDVKVVENKIDAIKSVKPIDSDAVCKIPKIHYYGTGKRKTSIAKVWLFEGNGSIWLNDVSLLDYIKREVLCNYILLPLDKLNLRNKYNIVIKSFGGGLTGQAGAVRLGIARALIELNPELKTELKKYGFLTRDSRIKERKKYGRKRARKGFQYRKR